MSASLAEDTPWKQRMLAYTGMGQGFVKVKKKHFRVKKEIFQFCFGQTFKSQSRLVNLSFFFLSQDRLFKYCFRSFSQV